MSLIPGQHSIGMVQITDIPELFEILADVCPQWQTQYQTLRDAAVAADCLPEYYAYLATSEGHLRAIRHSDVPDYSKANRAEQKARNRMLHRMNFEYGESDDTWQE